MMRPSQACQRSSAWTGWPFGATCGTADARRHEGLLDEARARGAFGVPTFFLGEQMFWGNDRLVLLEAALGGKATANSSSQVPLPARGRGA